MSWVDTYEVTLMDETDLTSNKNGSAFDVSFYREAVFHLKVTKVADSPVDETLDVKIQESLDNSTWIDVVTFSQATSATTERKTLSRPIGKYLRAVATVGGTSPSATFTVKMIARA